MDQSRYFFKWRHVALLSIVFFGLSMSISTLADTKDKVTKKQNQVKKVEPAKQGDSIKQADPGKPDEPPKQSGDVFVKFYAGVSDAAIKEVADHYGANEAKSLNSAQSSSHEHPAQWRKLRFESVDSLRDLADRILQDIRVDAIEHQRER